MQEHGIQLPDEYDSIHTKMQLFWGVDPQDLQKIEAEWEFSKSAGITFGTVDGGPLEVLRNLLGKSEEDKTRIQRPLLNRLAPLRLIDHLLPDFRAVVSPDDNPNLVMDWRSKDKIMVSVENGTCENSPLFHRAI